MFKERAFVLWLYEVWQTRSLMMWKFQMDTHAGFLKSNVVLTVDWLIGFLIYLNLLSVITILSRIKNPQNIPIGWLLYIFDKKTPKHVPYEEIEVIAYHHIFKLCIYLTVTSEITNTL